MRSGLLAQNCRLSNNHKFAVFVVGQTTAVSLVQVSQGVLNVHSCVSSDWKGKTTRRDIHSHNARKYLNLKLQLGLPNAQEIAGGISQFEPAVSNGQENQATQDKDAQDTNLADKQHARQDSPIQQENQRTCDG